MMVHYFLDTCCLRCCITEFMFQKYRHIPEIGTTLIWPAHFTHKHRGGMVLKGEKLYVTGWVMITPDDF